MHITDSLGHEIDGTLLSVTIYQYYVHSYACSCICIYLSTCRLIFFITKMYLWVQITQSRLVFQQCYHLLIYWCFFFSSSLLLNVQNMNDVHFILFCIANNFIKINIFKYWYCHGNTSLLCMIIFIDWLRALDW